MTEPAISLHPPSPEVEARTAASLKLRWFYLLPAVFITYSLAYLDRANYGFGAAAGLAATLHITGPQSSLLGAIFFLGYFSFQVPGAILARKRSATRLVFGSLIVWGILAALTGVVRQFWVLALVRFLLGVAESFIFPAMLLLLTRWFTRSERSRANTILILGNPITVLWMSAITGYLIQAFGWQKTFIYEGIPSVVWAVVWIFLVKDNPSQASWMTPQATALLESRLTQEQLAVSPIKNVRAALLRPDVVLLSVIYFLWSVGVYGFVIWLPVIVQQGSAMSMGRTGLISAVPYLAAIFAMLFASWRSDKTLRRAALVTPFLFASGLAMLVSFVFSTNFPIAFAGLVVAGACMYAPYGPFFAIIPERVARNVTAEVIAMINSFGALGAFFGSYLVGWLRSVTGDSRAGFLLMALSLVASAGLMLLLKPMKPEPTPRLANLTPRENQS